MPQMAPISWLFLFIIFSITLIIFSILNYFNFYQNKSYIMNKTFSKKISLNWKW